MRRRFEGQVAVVTGAAQGIGRAIAARLAGDGCGVAIVDRDRSLATGVAESLGAAGVQTEVYDVDVTDWEAVKNLATAVIEDFGKVDILINNVGWACPGAPLVEQPNEVWEQSLLINLTSQFYCCKAVVPAMVARGYGRIINVSSVAGKEGNSNLAPYSTAKAGVIGLTKALGKELATTGVLVNCICPAVIETEGAKMVGPETQQALVAKIPMGRMGQPEEVASLVAFLASHEVSFSTGAVYDISGGRATY